MISVTGLYKISLNEVYLKFTAEKNTPSFQIVLREAFSVFPSRHESANNTGIVVPKTRRHKEIRVRMWGNLQHHKTLAQVSYFMLRKKGKGLHKINVFTLVMATPHAGVR